jgi:hypothetical protein
MKTNKVNDPLVGDKIYVPSSLYMSRGSDDFAGGIATVSKVEEAMSGGEMTTFIEIKERPNHGYNWGQVVGPDQEKLKKEYKNQIAHPDPDVDTPWIEDGDLVDGKEYHGPPVW